MQTDLHYLSVFDPSIIKNEIDELELMQLTSNAMGFMFADLQKQKREFSHDGYLIEIPPPNQILPREKPLPPMERTTKWDKFAKERGIRKLKKDRFVIDQVTGEERPRWGKGRITKNSSQNPIIEGKKGVSDFPGCPDPFTKQKADKKKRVADNQERKTKNDTYNSKHKQENLAYQKKEDGKKGKNDIGRKGGKKGK